MIGPISTPLRWIDRAAAPGDGFTWGTPWPRGAIASESSFGLRDLNGAAVPVQSWTLATWPDGSIKWSGHSAVLDRPMDALHLVAGEKPATPEHRLLIDESSEAIIVDTGVIRAILPRTGSTVIHALERNGRTIASGGRLISERSTHPDGRERQTYQGEVEAVRIERRGPVQTVVLITGRHVRGSSGWLPFRLRLHLTAGSEQIRIVHSMIWDGDAETDFLCALGIRFDVPLTAPLHDRHVRIAGTTGFLTEAARPITGLWKDPGDAARSAQIAGRATPPVDEWTPAPSRQDWPMPDWHRMLEHVPAWNDWTLAQLNADGYSLRKRTDERHGWVPIPSGRRSRGSVYLGQPDGGLEVGLRGFWQSYPTQLDVRGAATDTGSITVWLWSPEAQPMDVRFYHPGTHEQDREGQLETVEITYEDYLPGYGDAHGVGRTHELSLRATGSTPSHAELDQHAADLETPPQLACPPERLHAAGIFGDWSLPNRDHPTAAAIEDRLELVTAYLADQVEHGPAARVGDI